MTLTILPYAEHIVVVTEKNSVTGVGLLRLDAAFVFFRLITTVR